MLSSVHEWVKLSAHLLDWVSEKKFVVDDDVEEEDDIVDAT